MKKNGIRKLTAIIISVLLVVALVPAISVAAEDTEGTRFTYKDEDNIQWHIELYMNTLEGELMAEIYLVSLGGNPPSHLIIPETVTNPNSGISYTVGVLGDGSDIASGLISYSRLTEITIPDTVTKVGEFAFSSCDNLTKINGAENVNVWGAYSLAFCYDLTEFEFKCDVTTIPEYMFYACTSLNSVVIPQTVHTIEQDAFRDCSNLNSVLTLRKAAMTSIHGFAFRGATKAKIYAPEGAQIHSNSVVSTVPLVMLADGITTSFSETEMVYNGEAHQPVLTVKSSVTQNEVDPDNYTLSYYRNNEVTTDFINAGTIKVVIEGDIYKGTYGTGIATYDISPRNGLVVIAHDKSVEDGSFATGTATDVMYWGLLDGDVIESVKLTADGDSLVPGDVVIKNGDLDVSDSYSDIIYVNGRSFTEKSIESLTKTTEGNIDTYTVVFGDGTTETLVITNGVDGKDGQDGAAGAQGPQGEKGDTGASGSDGAAAAASKGGCGSTIGISAISIVSLIALAGVAIRKKENS